MFDQPAARLHQPLLGTRQRPVPDSLRQSQTPPKVSQVIGNDGQPQPRLVRPEPVTNEPRHLHCLLSFFDPLLRCPALIVEPHHRPTRQRQIRHNEPHSRVQLPGDDAPPSPPPVGPSSNQPPDRESPCTRTSRPALPELRKSLAGGSFQ